MYPAESNSEIHRWRLTNNFAWDDGRTSTFGSDIVDGNTLTAFAVANGADARSMTFPADTTSTLGSFVIGHGPTHHFLEYDEFRGDTFRLLRYQRGG